MKIITARVRARGGGVLRGNSLGLRELTKGRQRRPFVRPPRRRENQIEKTLVFSSITPQTISLNSHPRCQRIPGRIPKLQQEFRSKSSRSAGSTPRARILFMFCFFLFLRFVPIILAVLVVVGTSPVGKCGFFLVGTESADGSPYFPSFI